MIKVRFGKLCGPRNRITIMGNDIHNLRGWDKRSLKDFNKLWRSGVRLKKFETLN